MFVFCAIIPNLIDRGYMVLCRYCRKNVKPKIYSTWNGFIRGLGIFYLIYIITKTPHCPNCNFPMPRRNMVFAIQFPQYPIKLAKISVLQLIHFKDIVISASRKSYLNRKLDPSKYFASMNTHKITSFNMMANDVHSSIGLESYILKFAISLLANLMVCDKDVPSSLQQQKTNEPLTTRLRRKMDCRK
jgi:hypothetical protein